MRKTRRWLAATAAVATVIAATTAVTVIAGTGVANAESNGGVKVMPLGDSITDGLQNPGGYRIQLWQDFVDNGYRVDFVGSQSNGPASLGDHDHEGLIGWRIDQIDANIVNWLRTYQPHTVLLHIGTNDIQQNYDLANAPNRLSALIDHITGTLPGVEVFVAQIIPLANATENAEVRTFNAAIPGIVQSKVNAGAHVHLVDMYDALTTADLLDGIHPTLAGYNKMAAVWYSALLSVAGSIGTPGNPSQSPSPTPSSTPSSSPGSGHAIVGGGSGRCVDVPGAQSSGTQVQLWDCNGGANQSWTNTASGQLTVTLSGSTYCLDANGRGTSPGTKAIIWPCNGQNNQQWNLNSNGTITGVQSGLCLDATGAATGNGTQLELWTCNGGSNQQWALK